MVSFWILLIVTAVEVILGIIKPTSLTENYIIGVSLLNMTFIILTIVKAYYIVYVYAFRFREKKSKIIHSPSCLDFNPIFTFYSFD